jgi:hypothetical protein
MEVMRWMSPDFSPVMKLLDPSVREMVSTSMLLADSGLLPLKVEDALNRVILLRCMTTSLAAWKAEKARNAVEKMD